MYVAIGEIKVAHKIDNLRYSFKYVWAVTGYQEKKFLTYFLNIDKRLMNYKFLGNNN